MLTGNMRAQMFGGMPEYIRKLRAQGQPSYVPGQVQSEPMPEVGAMPAPMPSAMPAQRHSNAPPMGLMAKGAPQQAQEQPKFDMGLFNQSFDKPKMSWSDKIGIASGYLMDLDGSFGTGNADKFRAMYDERVDEQRSEFERKRQESIMMAAAQGDPTALAYLDPLGNRSFQYGMKRDGVQDARYEDETKYGRGRDALSDQRYDTEYTDSRNDLTAARAAQAAERQPRDMWQSAGDGVIFNQRTGATRDTAGGSSVSGPGRVDPRQTDNDFFRSQGIEAQLTQFATGDGGVGINQQGVYDDTRPDDASGPNSGSYDTYRARTRGAGDTKRISTIRENTATAVNDLDILLNEAQTLIEEGVPSGAFAKQRADLGRFNSGLKATTGLDLSGFPLVPDETETAQMGAMQSVQTQLALLRTQLTKGAISNYEMEMFIQSVPGLSNTPEGNQLILKNMRNMQARAIAYGEAADTWDQMFGGVSAANPKTGQSFDQAWAEYTKNNPVFDLRGAPIDANPTSGTAPRQTGRAPRSRGDGGPRPPAQPPTIRGDDDFDALPSGTEFIGPDGKRYRKP